MTDASNGRNKPTWDVRLLVQIATLIGAAFSIYMAVRLDIAALQKDVTAFTTLTLYKFEVNDKELSRLDKKDESIEDQIDALRRQIFRRDAGGSSQP